MPTPPTSDLPRPKDWDEFEDIVWDIFIRRWQDPKAKRYGRSGQRQNGVDIYGKLGETYVAVQCKRYADGQLKRRILEAEIEKAEHFAQPLTEFIIATTDSRDVVLQDAVLEINQKRSAAEDFAVDIFFWEDLTHELTVPDNVDLLKRHYGGWIYWFSELDSQASISGARAAEILPAYMAAVKEKWRKIDTVSGSRIQLTNVYVMLQAMRSQRRTSASERPDKVLPEESLEHTQATEPPHAPDAKGEVGRPPDNYLPPAPPVSLNEAFREHKQIVLLGEPGAGKSVSLQYIGLYFASANDSSQVDLNLGDERIPFFISLKSYEDLLQSKPLVTALATALQDSMPLADVTYEEALACIQLWSRQGQLALLLDGLDEVQEEKRGEVLQAIRAFAAIESSAECRIIVASRTASYRQEIGAPFQEFVIKPFTNEEAQPYLASWLAILNPAADNNLPAKQQEAEWLISKMEADSGLEHMLDNPLLLQMIVETYVETGDIVANRFGLYSTFVENVAKRRAKDRGIKDPLLAEASAALEQIAWTMQTSDDNDLDALSHALVEVAAFQPREMLDMLREQMGLLIYDGPKIKRKVHFTHNTFQEYFVARRLRRIWRTDRERAWNLLQPRLHHPDWREPIFLLASSMRTEEVEDLLRCVLNAGTDYERELHRDLNFAGTLMGRGYEPTKKVRQQILRKAHWLTSNQRHYFRLTALWLPFLLGFFVPALLLPWWAAIIASVLWIALWIVFLLDRWPWVRGLFWWPSRVVGGAGDHERQALLKELPQYGVAVVPILIRALGWRGEHGYYPALEALEVISDPLSVPDFVQSLQLDRSCYRGLSPEITGLVGDPAAVPALTKSLESADEWVRRDAIKTLGKINDPAATAALIRFLEGHRMDEDEWARKDAVEALGKSGDPAAIVPLVQILEGDDWFEQLASIDALGELGEVAIPALIRALGHDDWHVRNRATAHLKELGPVAVPALVLALEDDSEEVRRRAVEVLEEIDPAAIPAPVQVMDEEAADVSPSPLEIPAESVDSAAVPDLIKALGNETEEVREQAALSLLEIGETAVPALILAMGHDSEDVQVDAASILLEMGETAVPALIHTLSNGPADGRVRAAWALGEIGDPAAVPMLIHALEDDQKRVRIRSAEALGKMGDPIAVPGLIEALKHDNVRDQEPSEGIPETMTYLARWLNYLQNLAEEVDGFTFTYEVDNGVDDANSIGQGVAPGGLDVVVWALVRVGAAAVPALMQALHDDSKEVRLKAAWALEEISDPVAAPALIEALSDDDEDVRTKAAWALEKISDPAAVPILTKMLDDDQGIVRARAAAALGKFKDTAAVPALIRFLTDDNEQVRESVVKSLGEIGDPATIPALRQMLEDDSVEVRMASVAALAKFGEPLGVPTLVHAFEHGDEGLRMAIGKVLVDTVDSVPAPILIKVVEVGSEESRVAAAKKLGKIGDAAAAPALVQALNDDSDDVSDEAFGALRKLGAAAVPTLIQAMRENSEKTQEEANQVDEEEDGGFWGALLSLFAAGDGAEWEVNDKAVLTLVSLGAVAVPPLIETLEDDNPEVRYKAAWALGEIGDPAALPIFIHALKDDNERIRTKAAGILGEIGDRTAVSALINALEDDNKDVCKESAAALGKIGDEAAIPALIRLLDDDDSQVHEVAINALKMMDNAALSPLTEAALVASRRESRQTAVQALTEIYKSEVIPVLVRALRDKVPDIRLQAANGLEALVVQMSSSQVQEALGWTRWLSYDSDMYRLFARLASQQSARQ